MKVKVESCFNGVYCTKRVYFNGHWFVLRADNWDRKTASEALDIIEKVYHINRKNVRFVHA